MSLTFTEKIRRIASQLEAMADQEDLFDKDGEPKVWPAMLPFDQAEVSEASEPPPPNKRQRLQNPTEAELSERAGLFSELTIAAAHAYRKRREPPPDMRLYLAQRCGISPSEVSRWLPPRCGRKREVKVCGQTDTDIRDGIAREMARLTKSQGPNGNSQS